MKNYKIISRIMLLFSWGMFIIAVDGAALLSILLMLIFGTITIMLEIVSVGEADDAKILWSDWVKIFSTIGLILFATIWIWIEVAQLIFTNKLTRVGAYLIEKLYL